MIDAKTALNQLAQDIKKILEDRIRRYGVNPKTGTNTLVGSELERSLQVYPTEDGLALQVASYWEFVARGWKRTHNYPGTMSLFVRNVDDWVRRKHIRLGNLTQSQIVWAIVMSIMKNGLRERPFMIYDDEGDLSKMIPELDATVDKWFDILWNMIIEEIDKFFSD